MSSPERLKTSKEQSTSDLDDNQPRPAAKELELQEMPFEMGSVSIEEKQIKFITNARECPQMPKMWSTERLRKSKEQSTTTSNSEDNQTRTAKEWEREILSKMYSSDFKSQKKIEVKQTELITDARELFGSDMKRKVSLRTDEDHRMGRPIVLKQFDPNLKAQKVVCRHPKCKIVKPESNVGEDKRDLYLCLGHRKKLGDYVKDICASKKVHVQVSLQPKKGIFEGYTSMIGYLDQAYLDCMTSRGSSPMGWTTDPLVKEAILNVRNYFMVVNAVLNPDDANLGMALPPVYQILRGIFDDGSSSKEFIRNLVNLLEEVVLIILFTFGVLYTWVSLALSNSGAQIGAGVGGIVGGVAGFFMGGGPFTAVGGVAAAAVCGGLIGNGISKLFGGQPQHDIQQFRLYWSQCQGDGGEDADGRNAEIYKLFFFRGSSYGIMEILKEALLGCVPVHRLHDMEITVSKNCRAINEKPFTKNRRPSKDIK